jgi:hypothetical protein
MSDETLPHPLVSVLEFAIKRLIVKQCISSTDPGVEIAEWAGTLADYQRMAEEISFSKDVGNMAAQNAISIAGETAQFAEDLMSELGRAVGIAAATS